MAETTFGTGHSLTQKLWSKSLAHEALARTYIKRFMGTGDGNVIQIREETSKDAGDQITIGLRMQLTGTGVANDGALEGNEEALDLRNDAIIVQQLRHAVLSGGRESEQRVNFSVRQEAHDGLADWWAGVADQAFFNQCGGDSGATAISSGMSVPTEPSPASRLVTVGGTAEGVLGSGDTFDTATIDVAVERARTANPMLLRPVKVNGADKFVMFIHEFQRTALRKDTNWNEVTNAAWQGARGSHPIYEGSIGEWNGVVLHSSNRNPVPTGNANARRAFLCGAQASWMAFGRGDGPGRYSWVEETFDYNNKLGVSAGCIWGLKKSVFDNEAANNKIDFGVIAVSSYAAAS